MAEREAAGQLHHLLVDDLGRRIATGALEPGALIVPADIASTFGASSATVREALRVLGAMGLLAAKRHAGTRVTDPDAWDYLDPQVITWRLSGDAYKEQLRELLEIRQSLEPLAARLVATDPDAELLERISAAAEAMAGAMARNDVHRFTEADIDFHTAIFEFCGNRMLARLSEVVSAALRARETLHLPFVDRVQHGLDLHVTLVQQIAAGDKVAEQTMRSIVDEVDYEYALALDQGGTT